MNIIECHGFYLDIVRCTPFVLHLLLKGVCDTRLDLLALNFHDLQPVPCLHRECYRTLYVGIAHTAPPTNTNFRLTFLLTRFQEVLYEDLHV